jgi:hypothetical protein
LLARNFEGSPEFGFGALGVAAQLKYPSLHPERFGEEATLLPAGPPDLLQRLLDRHQRDIQPAAERRASRMQRPVIRYIGAQPNSYPARNRFTKPNLRLLCAVADQQPRGTAYRLDDLREELDPLLAGEPLELLQSGAAGVGLVPIDVQMLRRHLKRPSQVERMSDGASVLDGICRRLRRLIRVAKHPLSKAVVHTRVGLGIEVPLIHDVQVLRRVIARCNGTGILCHSAELAQEETGVCGGTVTGQAQVVPVASFPFTQHQLGPGH